MPTADQARIEADRARPRITELSWALRPLKSVVRFMQTGAHPDDETSGMLAALAFRDGLNISYACSTRGEGGQNDVGQETGPALGALRTREMERACDILGMRLYWHSETPDDPITDFGFSKSGDETLGRWGNGRTLARFVDIVRTEKPDIICPTFLDVPGQHGHHRAMTQVAHDVMAAAADPAFPSNRAPWQVKKLYLPAWSGAGQSYDDDLPPPPATLTIYGAGMDEISGWSWERVGQQSRAVHRTQGMGLWVRIGHRRDWPLHLVESHVDGPDTALTSGLATRLGDLAALAGAESDGFAKSLKVAQSAIDDTINAFPAFDKVASSACRALKALQQARVSCPDNLRHDIVHRIDEKEVQLGHVLRLALGIDLRCSTSEVFLPPGRDTDLTFELGKGQAQSVEVALDLPKGWVVSNQRLKVDPTAATTSPYPATYDPRVAVAPAAVITMSQDGVQTSICLPFDPPPVILPARAARIEPDAAIINLATDARTHQGRIGDVFPKDAETSLDLPKGWQMQHLDHGFEVEAPADLSTGLYRIPLHLDDHPAMTIQRIDHPHTTPTAFSKPAMLRVLAVDARIPDVKVGYIGAGNDRVGFWLSMLGADVTDISNNELASESDLASFDTIVIGIFAMRFRDGLADALPGLHSWARAGGTLITLYHRPWDNWVPDSTPPHHLEIGQPSLRWRVTDETAEVRHLVEHPLLFSPNVIGPDDWSGWVKERGLYFAKSWDAAYTPLIEMSDPGEDPHKGALLVADTGKGRHIHTSLVLHHQMENLVPGAFRLMANFLAKRT